MDIFHRIPKHRFLCCDYAWVDEEVGLCFRNFCFITFEKIFSTSCRFVPIPIPPPCPPATRVITTSRRRSARSGAAVGRGGEGTGGMGSEGWRGDSESRFSYIERRYE